MTLFHRLKPVTVQIGEVISSGLIEPAAAGDHLVEPTLILLQ